MVRVALEFGEKLFCRNTKLVEIAAVAELNATWHHVYIETFHVVFRNIGRRIRNHSELAGAAMRTALLTMHIICFFGTNDAVLSRCSEYQVWLVNMNVNFSLAFCAWQHNRIAQKGERFP